MFSKTRRKESLGILQQVKMATNESGDHSIKRENCFPGQFGSVDWSVLLCTGRLWV